MREFQGLVMPNYPDGVQRVHLPKSGVLPIMSATKQIGAATVLTREPLKFQAEFYDPDFIFKALDTFGPMFLTPELTIIQEAYTLNPSLSDMTAHHILEASVTELHLTFQGKSPMTVLEITPPPEPIHWTTNLTWAKPQGKIYQGGTHVGNLLDVCMTEPLGSTGVVHTQPTMSAKRIEVKPPSLGMWERVTLESKILQGISATGNPLDPSMSAGDKLKTLEVLTSLEGRNLITKTPFGYTLCGGLHARV